jgi:general secretion pathway protein I
VKHTRGFTLLEVLMAVAILGLGLSVLLGAQTGLFASASRAQHISVATGLARCRVSELELDLLQKGFPLIDQESDGDCCMGESSDGYDCSWKVQRVELPDPSEMNASGDGGLDLSTDALGTDALGAGSNPVSTLLALGQGTGSALGEKPDLGALATELTGSMGGTDAIAGIVMGFVYPTLKPMLEASIRKVIVSVRWREGVRERSLAVTYYVTDPKQAAAASEEAETALGGIESSMNTNPAATGTATSGVPK